MSIREQETARIGNAMDRAFGLRMDKYRVERIGGTPHKHDDCSYFVLDLQHDFFAGPALLAYADACKNAFPQLAFDLRAVAREISLCAALAAEPKP